MDKVVLFYSVCFRIKVKISILWDKLKDYADLLQQASTKPGAPRVDMTNCNNNVIQRI